MACSNSSRPQLRPASVLAVGEEQASRCIISIPPRSNPSARISRSPTTPTPARLAAPTTPLLRRRQLAVQRAELEDLRARLEVSKAQIGGLVYEKGVLNGSLRKRDAELRELAEEKVRAPPPLPASLQLLRRLHR